MKNNVKNQGVSETPMYIVIQVDWNSKYIMPIEIGQKYMQAISGAMEIVGSGDDIKLKHTQVEFRVTYLTEQAFKEMKLAAALDPPEDD